jgi:DNA ligase-1
MVFDGPLLKGDFKSRLKQLEKEIGTSNDTVKLISQTVCKSKEHLEELMDKICGGKGEGVMIKDPKSLYEHRRSYSLLKVKRFEDAEATVIGHERGTGRCDTMCGAIIVREKDGT